MVLFGSPGSPSVTQLVVFVDFFIVLKRDLFVYP